MLSYKQYYALDVLKTVLLIVLAFLCGYLTFDMWMMGYYWFYLVLSIGSVIWGFIWIGVLYSTPYAIYDDYSRYIQGIKDKEYNKNLKLNKA